MNYIEPDDTLHQSLVDIEPVTGKILRRAIRLQVPKSNGRAYYDILVRGLRHEGYV